MQPLGIFWGCQIPARFPFMEKALRLLWERLDLPVREVEGFTCCPEKALVKNLDPWVWILTAGRNLAVAEAAGLKQLLVPCNGCYSTLKTVWSHLLADPQLAERLNGALSEIGLKFRGTLQVLHLAEHLHDQLGPAQLRRGMVKSLRGMRLAVHYGCHMIRPSHSLQFDDPLLPTKFDALVEALGAKSIPYPRKMTCCGGEYSNVGQMEEAMAMARAKLLELKERSVDGLVVMCPACFMQFDGKQYLMQRQGEALNVPVFFYPELVGLAYGLDPEELGLGLHRIEIEAFLTRWRERGEVLGKVAQAFDLDSLERCINCQACSHDCPSALNGEGFEPHRLLEEILAGRLEQVLKEGGFWSCLECHTCSELCPQRFGMETVFTRLKSWAMAQGITPPTVRQAIDIFEKTGKLGEPQKAQRKKLNLPEPTASGVKQWKELLKRAEKGKG
ncbi:MAG: 4Fe-4S dicluster domain-containing protein [Candidatus Tectomicrobia bacterium]|uniref:4Fe-4S dicluster domain-containing protein n=1 Tax=Tectimicrobiota bacterium TaxID=2528274 RepID=A0A932CPN2_UNCTE|nr:4Fe-4S dicluster domain-containing protein [Candidatus Tectomicrobia bacterium]